MQETVFCKQDLLVRRKEGVTMKKRRARILALMLACTMTVLPASDVMAATTYDVSGAEVSQVLFPGDSMTGISASVMQGDTPVDIVDGTWTNDKDAKVYLAKTAEDGSIQLETVGYTLKVKQGTVKQKKSEEDAEKEKKHHYEFTDEDRPEISTDLAYYEEGDKVVLTADEPAEGMEFAGWSVESGELTLDDAASANIVIEMPEGGAVIAAQYREKQPELYAVTVNGGKDVSGAGSYTAGSTVEIAAPDRSEENLEFAGWSVDSGNTSLADAGAAATSFTMPEEAVSVTANYQQMATEPQTEAPTEPQTEAPTEPQTEAPTEPQTEAPTEPQTEAPAEPQTEAPAEPQTEAPAEPQTEAPTEPQTEAPVIENQKYELTVEYGSDSGEYAEGEQITITADDRTEEGMQFAGWFVESMNVQLDTNIETTASFTMPAGDVVIAATYEEAESVTEADQSETTVPATEEDQSETTVPVTESDQSETAAPVTESDQSETTAAAVEAGESESEAPAATEADQSESVNTVVLPDGQETPPDQKDSEAQPQLYAVTVENGAGSGQYAAGDMVTIEAGELEGKVFTGWTSENPAVTFSNAFAPITSFTMPEGDVKVRADYAAAQYEMTLDDGSGSTVTEIKEQGAEVHITAADRQADNLEFDYWAGTAVIAGVETELEFEDAGAADTSFVMPGGPVKVTAVYTEMITLHHVTVANGMINGSQTEIDCEDGTEITVTADPSEAGQAFSYWEVSGESVDLGDQAYASEIKVTVNQDMDFRAIYEGIEYRVTVNSGISNYETCTLGTKVTIRADEAPKGMEFDS